MIAHQDVAVYLNTKALDAFGNDVQELPAVMVAGEDSPSLIAAAGHMVPGARIVDTQRTGHEGMLLRRKRGCQIKSKALTPYSLRSLCPRPCRESTDAARLLARTRAPRRAIGIADW